MPEDQVLNLLRAVLAELSSDSDTLPSKEEKLLETKVKEAIFWREEDNLIKSTTNERIG